MDEDIAYVLTELKTWAVVGCSPQPWRDSHRIASMLQERGYRVIPVNPEAGDELLGERCFDTLPAGEGIEVVDLFRRSAAVSVHVDEAIAIGAKAVWMQLGVIDEESASRARAAGLRVVMNRCPAIELPRLEGR
jgi:predicted CoA-binding protein